MKLSIIVGTRPEIIKMSSIIKELTEREVPHEIIHTEQHYDSELSSIFFDELGIPRPNYSLKVGSGSQGVQTATALTELEKIFMKTSPELVLVEGDTNSVLASALAAVKLGIPVGHVEAGLRSYDLRMPEEHNRRLTDHLSSLLFAPTEYTADILKGENVWGDVFITGNTVIDACMAYMPVACKKSKILDKLNFDEYVLATAHRAENVDNRDVLGNIVDILIKSPLPVVYPLHPRTHCKLEEFGLYKKLANSDNVQLLDPVGYFDFLVLMKNCSFILTDSGGIQEEATAPAINKKVFVLRKSTERQEAVDADYVEVVGTDTEKVLKRINTFAKEPAVPDKSCPYGDGAAGKKIVDIILQR
jgi:UDP-N-acetylglucosamine 2-epimerase (non-hydrolysing)